MPLITSRVIWWKSTTALVVISPASTTRPVLHNVSAPTREYLSCASSASSTASEIWSETLSGWPSETDSDVNRKLDDMIFLYLVTLVFSLPPHSSGKKAADQTNPRTAARIRAG